VTDIDVLCAEQETESAAPVGGIAVKKQLSLRPFVLYSPSALSSLYVFQSGSCVHAVVINLRFS